jgi:hypothetical protein
MSSVDFLEIMLSTFRFSPAGLSWPEEDFSFFSRQCQAVPNGDSRDARPGPAL